MLGPQAADVGSEPGDRPSQPTRSASTVAGIPGSTANRARTRPSNGENDVTSARRSYLGGALDATAFTTVVLEIPNRAAIWAFGTPSEANLRINAQSSKVITLQSSSVHFSSVETVQFSNVVNTWAYRYSLRAVCVANGIVQKFIKPHCPWQNGNAERLNRTLATEWAYPQGFTTNRAAETHLHPGSSTTTLNAATQPSEANPRSPD